MRFRLLAPGRGPAGVLGLTHFGGVCGLRGLETGALRQVERAEQEGHRRRDCADERHPGPGPVNAGEIAAEVVESLLHLRPPDLQRGCVGREASEHLVQRPAVLAVRGPCLLVGFVRCLGLPVEPVEPVNE